MSKFRIAVLISGGGTTLRNLIERRDSGSLDVEIALTLSSNPAARGLEFSKKAAIPTGVFDHRVFSRADEISREIFSSCRNQKIDLVVCGGFLRRLRIPDDFSGRVINIHPSLIPDFCGKGMYGLYVHKAVIEAKRTESGCTVHVVDDKFDHGPIIAQRRVPVFPDDTPEQLADRVFQAECDLYPVVIRGVASGTVRIDSTSVQILAGILDAT